MPWLVKKNWKLISSYFYYETNTISVPLLIMYLYKINFLKIKLKLKCCDLNIHRDSGNSYNIS